MQRRYCYNLVRCSPNPTTQKHYPPLLSQTKEKQAITSPSDTFAFNSRDLDSVEPDIALPTFNAPDEKDGPSQDMYLNDILCTSAAKARFWDTLIEIGNTFNGPWLILGDFNAIFSQKEKKGGHQFVSSSFGGFKGFIDEGDLVDLGFEGNPYTWSNKRGGVVNIQLRLDRCLANTPWLSLFAQAFVSHLPAINSDHTPLILHTDSAQLGGPKPFCFKNMWIRDDSCKATISDAWTASVIGTPHSSLHSKIKATCFLFAIGTIVFGLLFIDLDTLEWKIENLNRTFNPEAVAEIVKIRISSLVEPRRILWTPSKNGKFTVSSTYLIANYDQFLANKRGDSMLWKHFWKAKIHERLKFFLWRILTKAILTACLMEGLWRNQNKILHGKEAESIDSIVRGTESKAMDHFRTQFSCYIRKPSPTRRCNLVISGLFPYHIYVDAACKKGFCCVAMLVRDNQNHIVFVAAKWFPETDAHDAELLAIHLACSWLKDAPFDSLYFASYCKVVVDNISNSQAALEWGCEMLTLDIRKFF
ncbi:hypothetical protein BUALT_Bualt13G0065400 [Buddleja alternifolia]|uniref:Reverse transcriptase n=1 Tax=Buddleja alternifolia TaxID=168488 RepID=A0AAV6WM09_9LAMI|nr:hypothetical protein BUALT_Bualt13G0065400 [Buddleja alternifolia]